MLGRSGGSRRSRRSHSRPGRSPARLVNLIHQTSYLLEPTFQERFPWRRETLDRKAMQISMSPGHGSGGVKNRRIPAEKQA